MTCVTLAAMPRVLLLLATVLLAFGLALPVDAAAGPDALAAAAADDCDCCPDRQDDEVDCCTWDLGACCPTLVAAATSPHALASTPGPSVAPPLSHPVELPPHGLLERDTGPPPTPPPIG